MTVDLEWYRSLPRKRSASGVVLRNHSGDILLVKPSYKDHWQLAGGMVDDLESPHSAALREVHEELGLRLDNVRLRVMDYVPSETLGDSYQMVWDGGVLTDEQIASIKLSAEELTEYGFFKRDAGEQLLSIGSQKRLASLWDASENHAVLYLEDGLMV